MTMCAVGVQGNMERGYWARRIGELDPGRDFHEIYRILVTYEFPWDMNQSLGFALYGAPASVQAGPARTYGGMQHFGGLPRVG